ncbi:hypothetical protein E8E15_003114 [Penicillium rubens]|uniref:Uncharacterized protein n=1 Tax=Penicillium chrysogenum TaxID=5076 RepID=A0A167U430_PENCH|nr:hypothetical protein E8E15_003114 [Penicillium rubens]KAJ5048983.1 hypothetical protein NUH16_007495 [Penicillium rubens]KZN88901.1 hypothetical protein EN45_074920 [Penicillium chrysogenum]
MASTLKTAPSPPPLSRARNGNHMINLAGSPNELICALWRTSKHYSKCDEEGSSGIGHKMLW